MIKNYFLRINQKQQKSSKFIKNNLESSLLISLVKKNQTIHAYSVL